jgi:hypothetical protein
MGTGMNDSVLAMTTYDDKLLVGGQFTIAGDKASAYLAKWTKNPYMCGDVNGDNKLNLLDIAFIINYLYRGGSAPNQAIDFNFDGKVNLLDVLYLINFLYRGGPAPSCS